MQARRITVPEGQVALAEAVRRVGSIAIVHETLSESFDEHVDFDDVADRVAAMVADVSTVATAGGDAAQRVVRRTGLRGRDPAGDGADRTDAELGGARVRGPGRGSGERHDRADRRPFRRPAADRRDRRRFGTAGELRLRDCPEIWACRSSAPWSSGSSTEPWSSATVTTAAPAPRSRWTSRSKRPGQKTQRPRGSPRGLDRRTCQAVRMRCAGVAALESATLVLAQTAPDTVVLAGFQSPRQALLTHVAASAHLLGLLDLHDRRPGVTDGEEQFRVLVEANGPVAPIHGGSHLSQ